MQRRTILGRRSAACPPRSARFPLPLGLLAVVALALAQLPHGTSASTVQTEEEAEAGLTGETSYESPQFGFEVEWDDPWVIVPDYPTTEEGVADELSLYEPMAGALVRFVGVFNDEDEDPSEFLDALTEDRLGEMEDTELVGEDLDAEVPWATISYTRDGVEVVQYTELHAPEEGESLLVIDYYVPADAFEDEFPTVGDAVTLDGDPLFQLEDEDTDADAEDEDAEDEDSDAQDDEEADDEDAASDENLESGKS